MKQLVPQNSWKQEEPRKKHNDMHHFGMIELIELFWDSSCFFAGGEVESILQADSV